MLSDVFRLVASACASAAIHEPAPTDNGRPLWVCCGKCVCADHLLPMEDGFPVKAWGLGKAICFIKMGDTNADNR